MVEIELMILAAYQRYPPAIVTFLSITRSELSKLVYLHCKRVWKNKVLLMWKSRRKYHDEDRNSTTIQEQKQRKQEEYLDLILIQSQFVNRKRWYVPAMLSESKMILSLGKLSIQKYKNERKGRHKKGEKEEVIEREGEEVEVEKSEAGKIIPNGNVTKTVMVEKKAAQNLGIVAIVVENEVEVGVVIGVGIGNIHYIIIS